MDAGVVLAYRGSQQWCTTGRATDPPLTDQRQKLFVRGFRLRTRQGEAWAVSELRLLERC
eukprot:599209-Prymnesium_polylepis.1